LHLDIASPNDQIKIDNGAALNLNIEASLEILKEKMKLVDTKLVVVFKQLLNFLNSLKFVLDAKL
jgi:hypothetical protein